MGKDQKFSSMKSKKSKKSKRPKRKTKKEKLSKLAEEFGSVQVSTLRKKAPRRKVEAKIELNREAFLGRGSEFKLFN